MTAYRGLSTESVKKSRKANGSNVLSQKKQQTFWQKYWSNFDDPIVTILLFALGINIIFTLLGKVSWFEAAGILTAILLSTLVSTFSEYKNETVFQKIQEKAAQIKCKVYRNANLEEVPINDIVCGDLLLLQNGDMIPADAVVIEGSVKVDQSALNGESKECEKTSTSEDYKNKADDFFDKHKVFRGTVVCGGECTAEVLNVGDKTVYGQLSHEIQTEGRESPLTLKLTQLAKKISTFGYIGGITIAIAFLFQIVVVNNGFDQTRIFAYCLDYTQLLSDAVEALILGIIVIVVAVPEGLPLMIAIVCSLNMKKMLKDNVLVRKLVGIETAGSLNILFSDKTGTITKGKLEVVEFIDGNGNSFTKYEDINLELRKLLAVSAYENSSARRNGKKIIGGNATEKALLTYIKDYTKLGIHVIKKDFIPFSSDNKFSACTIAGDYKMTLIKGAPEKILKCCTTSFDKKGKKNYSLSSLALEDKINKLAHRSIRVLALASSEKPISGDKLPDGLCLIGLIGIRDDVRREAVSAIYEVQRAGVQVVMVTGDKRETAVAIAKEAGLLKDSSDIVMTSEELACMVDREIKDKMLDIRVIARALPNDKSRLVRLAQEMNLVVGMTGDGVNDAPALKAADVGFAMGSGTEVAKEAGDIVIMDDNFLSIKKAILYGRTIYNNIKKFITFQLTINVAAVSVSLVGPLIGVERPLDITQMLWINLVMDTLSAIAFGNEPAIRKYLSEKPKTRDENIIDKNMWSAIVVNGLFICFVSMVMFLSPKVHSMFRPDENHIYFYTGYFSFFIFACIFNAFNARVEGMSLIENISLNKGFLITMFSICVIQLFMTYYGGIILRTNGLVLSEWFVVMLMAVLIIPVDLIRKKLLKNGFFGGASPRLG